MQHRRTTFSKFIIENERRSPEPDADLTALLNDIQTGCKFIASAVSRGALDASGPSAHEIMLRECEWGGKLCGIASSEIDRPYAIPADYPRGRYLLAFDALDGSGNLDVDVAVGTIFSVLRAPDGVTAPSVEDFLQPGNAQIAAGFALYGPSSTIVITLGEGVHGFTLDREIGAYTLTHPDMRIPTATNEFAINASNERVWEPPVRHYIDECVKGTAGPRKADFTMRWVDSLAAEVYRLLVRGGMFIDPLDTEDSARQGRLRVLFEAAPMAMIVEQAGGAASTGRGRILDVVPTTLDARVPVILGSSSEVERLEGYYEAFDRGEELTFETPLFNTRSLFRAG
ncbi:MAG: class 1 fructose-bisphosphatase [Candidatus Eremiobacteraeota bacterium]|nr:class 1 fructose-bisphosphatase [Candidatus Eremiobacteraeota bacterium]